MDKERSLALVLLDMCAFAYFQDRKDWTRRGLEAACRLAEEYSLPEAKLYRIILDRLDREVSGGNGSELDAGPGQLLDIVSL